MPSQFSFWLYPLLMFSVLALCLRARLGFAWAWGFILQVLAIGVCAILGLTLGPDWFYAILGWALFVIFAIIPRVLLSRLDTCVSLLRAKQAIECAHQLKYFYWGQPGQFWIDMTTANSLFLERRVDEALEILHSWEKKKLPKAVSDVIYTYRLSGRAVLGQWQLIVDEYEAAASAATNVSSRLSLAASRAYLEVGNADQAALTLERSQLNESRASTKSVALTLLPYFALLGAMRETEKMFEIGEGGKTELPEYVKLYWLARCQVAAEKIGEAKALFQKCAELIAAQNGPANWQARVQHQLEKANSGETVHLRGNVSGAIARGWRIFEQCEFVERIIFPNKTSFVVIGLIALILFLMILSVEVIRILPNYISGCEPLLILHLSGRLEPNAVLHGQWWRLITYLFLHAHTSHALINVIGLFWFGRMAVNIYGPGRFLFIFIAAGTLSGICHVLLAKHMPAIGASGAVMGIFGAVAAGIWRLKDSLPRGVRRQELAWMLGLALSQIVLDQYVPHVASMAHLGGLVFGFLLGLLLQPRKQAKLNLATQEA
ncbi:MAG TPA: rhomboid family intramembrane serine protease [Candidatus Melainabacteria bacterium]|jgi:rhomboid protease GluP|nr:rhomboid family intramembrane serine protease [Candidatus Melainabacteria bacterium]HIN65328.1 rhomboid family intramembrane serine protease [Candidatus Obscuribacterales bacterium]